MYMIKVFLVEDEVVIRDAIKNSINWEQEGYEFVGEASDGELALPMDHDSGADRQSGFGVANVNQRIHVYYGEQYGISYESHPGEGTLVRIQVADHVSEVPMIR